MASFSYTFTLTNGSTADADEVMQNFNDARNGVTDGTKDISVAALTAAGTATLNGAVTLGNASSDDVTFTGSLASSIPIKTTNTYNIGSALLGLASIYFGTDDTDTVRVLAAGTMAASRTYTLPDAGDDASFVMTKGAATLTGVRTFSDGINLGDETLSDYDEGTWTPSESSKSNMTGTATFGAATYQRIGNTVHCFLFNIGGLTLSTAGNRTYIIISEADLPGTTNSTEYYGHGRVRASTGSKLGASAIGQSGGSNTDIILSIDSSPLASSGGLTISSIHFWYQI